MHDKAESGLLVRFLEISRHTQVNPEMTVEPPPGSMLITWSSAEDVEAELYLDSEWATTYTKFVADFAEKGAWQQKLSLKYIRKQVNQQLGEVLHLENPTEEIIVLGFHTLIKAFDAYNTSLDVYTPLTGITMEMDTLDFGEVTLINMKSYAYADFEARIQSLTANIQPDDFRQTMVNWMTRNIRDTVCARFTAVADSEQAQLFAESATKRAVDVLRFTAALLYPRQLKLRIGLAGEVQPAGYRETIILPTHEGSFHWHGKAVGAPVMLSITSTLLEDLKRRGIIAVLDILRKPTKTEFDNALLAGIHMFANTQNETDPIYELLNLIMCLEIFFTRKDGGVISQTITEGVAFLLGKDLEARKFIKNSVTKLYKKRSTVTHGSTSVDVTDSDVELLYSITRDLLLTLIQRHTEFQTKEDLSNWIEDRKLS